LPNTQYLIPNTQPLIAAGWAWTDDELSAIG